MLYRATDFNPQIKTSQTIRIYFVEKRGGKKRGSVCSTKPLKALDFGEQEVGDFAQSPVHLYRVFYDEFTRSISKKTSKIFV